MPIPSINLRSLKTRLSLFTLLIFFIGIGTIALYTTLELKKNMVSVLSDQQFSTVTFVAQAIDQEIEARVTALTAVAENLSPALLDKPSLLQKYLEQRLLLNHLFNAGAFVVNAKGITIASFPLSAKRLGVNYLDREFLTRTFKERRAIVGKPVMGKMLQRPLFTIATPILDSQGKVLGALIGVTDLSKPNFLDKISDSNYGKSGGYVLLIPKDRLIVTATDKTRIMQPLPAIGVNPMLDRFIEGYEGSAVYTNPLGSEVLGSAKKIPSANWLMGLTLPVKEAFSPIRNMLLAMLGLSLLAGALIWWMLRHQLAPLSEAASTLALFSAAELPLQPLTIARQDEIGALIAGFNQLLATLGQREELLKRSEENLAVTLQSIGDAVITTDIAGNIVNMNPVAEALTGWHEVEAQNQPLDKIFHIINSQTRAPVNNPVHQVLSSGKIVGLANHTSLLSRNGTEYQIADSAAPIRNRAGATTGVVLVFHDVTEEYRQQALVLARESELQKISDVLPAPVTRIDKEGRFLFVSAAFERWFGMRAEDVIGRTQRELINPALFAKAEPYFKRALAGEKVIFEIDIPSHSGELLSGLVTVLPEYDAAKKICGYFVIVADISARKQAEQETQKLRDQLTQATKMEAIGHLTAGIAHDFNNMLGAIMGYTELARNMIGSGAAETQARFLEEVIKASNRAKELIAQMLTFSRLQTHIAGQEAPAIMLAPIVKEVVSLLRSSIPSSIELNYQLDEAGLQSRINPVQLHQIILNLGINARDAISAYGRIDIGLSRAACTDIVCASCKYPFSGDYVRLTVRDSGSGIEQQILNNIFNPFFTTKEVGKGTGMGLSVVHGLVHALGGHILVESTPGQGTAISILLPLARIDTDETPANPAADSADISLKGVRIMVVDDERIMTDMLSEFLLIHGALVSTFNSPLTAWEAFEQNPDATDLVITDETMPGLTGIDLAVRMLKLRPALPVILCTGYSEHATPELAQQTGVAAFFYKPLKIAELLHKIHTLVKMQRS